MSRSIASTSPIGVAPNEVSQLIGDIYDCALEPARWKHVIASLGTFTQSPTVALAITDLKTKSLSRLYDYGWSPEFFETYERLGHLNPVMFEARLRPVGNVIALSEVVRDEDFIQSRFYRECLQPFGQRDGIGVLGLRSGKRIAFVATTRTDNCPRFTTNDVRKLALLAPHITRALKISDAMEMASLRSQALEAMLDQLAAGVVLIGRGQRIVHMNKAAERFARRAQAIRVTDNRLVPLDRAAGDDLQHAIAQTNAPEREQFAAAPSVALPDPDGRGLIATVLSLERGRRQDLMAPLAAMTAVFLQEVQAGASTGIPGTAFARLYGLTASELRVAVALAPGLGIREASELLGLSEATVKSHLQRVFAKTNTHRQTELVQLLRASKPVYA
jgi:DNA-binding CsgD family transcriptional regulator/PAS domain-containing protein